MPILWALAYLVAGTVDAAESAYDYEKPEFWNRSYTRTEYGKALAVQLDVREGAEEPDAALAKAAAWMRAQGGRSEDGFQWEIAGPLSPAFIRRLMADLPVRSLTDIQPRDENLFRDLEVLRYKRKHVGAELDSLPPPPAFSSLRGLAAAQLAGLSAFIKAIESADKKSLIVLDFRYADSERHARQAPSRRHRAPERMTSVTYVDGSLHVRRENLRTPVEYWSRAPLGPVCAPRPQTVTITVRSQNIAQAHQRLVAWADENASKYVGDVCSIGGRWQSTEMMIGMEPFALPNERIDDLKRFVLSLGSLSHWNVSPGGTGNDLHAIAREKVDGLRADMRNGAARRRTPHINALAEAEIARLTPYADLYGAWDGLSIVTARIEFDRGGHP